MFHVHILKIFYITFYSSHWIHFSSLIFRGTKQSFHSNVCIGDLSLRRNIIKIIYWISSVWSLSRVRLFATPWIAALQASLSITNSQSSPKLISIGLVMPSSHIYPLSSPSPPAPGPTQHQGLFQWVNSSHEVAKVLEFQL